MSEGKRIINIDETAISATDSRRRSWVGFGVKNITSHSQRLNQVNKIAAVSSSSDFFYTLNIGKTNSKTFLLFMAKLIAHLDSVNASWRANTVLMIDNAPYHRSSYIMSRFKAQDLPLLYLGPYQYKMAPAEMLFAYLKGRDINKLSSRPYSK
jgi:transposase